MDIEELLNQHDSEFEVSKTIKEKIKHYLDSLESIFEKDQGKNFLVNHTKNIDIIIKAVYKYTLRTHFKTYLPMINTIPISIIAMGSYGREQLCVYSDIDLLILYKDIPAFNILPVIESMLQILWDSGMKLGHRVHEIDTLFEAAHSDHTIKTALMESRFIYGSKYLWMESEVILKQIRLYEQKTFISQKIQERKNSIKKYPLTMEPDIKSSPGGLRDFNTLFWITKILFNATKIRDISSIYISSQEYSELMISVEFLYRLRSALHLSSGKKSDKLLMELIPDVASKLKLDQTKTVKKTFEAMHHINTITMIVIKRITHTLFFESTNIPLLKAARISKNIYLCDQTLYTSMYAQKENLHSILIMMEAFGDLDVKYDISFIHYLKIASTQNIDKTLLNQTIKSLFDKRYSAHIFFALYRAHQLNFLIPPLRKVAYLPQFDGYHTHSVERHSIYTLQALEDITDPHVCEIFDHLSLEDKAIVRLCAFLHDCGKGRKKDHSILGASMIRKYALNLGFDEQLAKDAATLVRYHTVMSNTAHREDIYNEKVIYSFIAKLQKPKILKQLFILTYADISSVSKTSYTQNSARLLYSLYKNALEAFENKTILNEAAKRNKKEKTLLRLPQFSILPRGLQKKILEIQSNLLFFKFLPDEILDIASWIWHLQHPFEYKIQNQLFLRIDIISKESVNIGYILAKLSNLSVVNMDIYKFFDHVKFFRIDFDQCIDEDEILLVKEILDDALSFNKKSKLKTIDIKKSDILIDCNHSKTYAKMKLQAPDQKGLLANIMTIFDDIGIDIASAKIQTIKQKARNLFLIEKNGNFCNNKEDVINKLIIKTTKTKG